MSMTEIIKKMEQPVGDNELYEYVDHPSHYNKPGRKECIEEKIDIRGSLKQRCGVRWRLIAMIIEREISQIIR